MIRRVTILFLLALSPAVFSQKQDTVKHRILKQWTLSKDYAEEVPVAIDTVFSLFNRFKIADRYSPVNATLGNYGLPFYQVNFFDRITDPDKFLFSHFYPFMYLPDKPLYMNTQVPFTELAWTVGSKRETSEQTFRVRHSQNVNRFWNFGLIYDIIFDLGQYSYQRAEDKTATLYTSYTGKKYKLYFSSGLNNIVNLENGGVTDPSLVGSGNARDVPTRLGGVDNAKTTLKNWNILLVQKYTLAKEKPVVKDTASGTVKTSGGLSGTFSHILSLERTRRSYADAYPKSGFYDSIYISDKETFDSLSARMLKNTVRFDFETDETRKFRLGGGFGIRNEIFHFSQVIPTHDDLLADTAGWKKNSNAVVGRLYNSIGEKFRWAATGELYLTGYKAGDFDLNGEITKSFDLKKGRASWIITGGIINRQPSFWFSQWGSNHFEWHNNLKKEFRTDIGSTLTYPARKFSLRFNYAIIKNYTDFDSLALPSQFTGGLSVASFSVGKSLKAWKFHLDPDVLIQKSSNSEVLDLPLATIRAAVYFEHLFRFKKTNGRLNTQLGADLTWHSLYHSYAYMPATGQFYRQYDTETGSYPYVNIFLNFKLKRTRVFVMIDHANYGLMGETLGKKFFMVPYYPMNISMFRFGFAWTFYN